MAKTLTASHQPAGRVTVTSDDIRRRAWTKQEKHTLRVASNRQAAGDDSGIDFPDIPRLQDAQLANMVRLRAIRP